MLNDINVAGINYKVELKETVEIREDKNYLGACRFKDAIIEISSSMNEQRQEQILIHELMHAIFNEAGIDIENEEDIVNRSSLVLYQVLKDNYFSFLRK